MSPRKQNSSLSQIPEEEHTEAYFMKGLESLYSPASSRGSAVILYKCKNSRFMPRSRTCIAAGGNDVRQRVLSARRLRIKDYQNKLCELQKTIHELVKENRVMRIMHQRQDKALSKYESTNAELPNLLRSHEEELRYWTTRYRKILLANRQLEYQLKKKDAILMELSDQNKLYSHLNQKKNLEGRHRLTEKVNSLQMQLEEKDNDMRMLSRRLQLELKQVKHQLLLEEKKTKGLQLQVQKLRNELAAYKDVKELNPPKTNNRQITMKNNHANRSNNAKLSSRQIVEFSSSSSEQSDNDSKNIADLVMRLKKSSFNHYLRAQIAKFKQRKRLQMIENNNKQQGSDSHSTDSDCKARLLPQRHAQAAHQTINNNNDDNIEKHDVLKLPIAEPRTAQKFQQLKSQENVDAHAHIDVSLESSNSSSDLSSSPTIINKSSNRNKLPICVHKIMSQQTNAKIHLKSQSTPNEPLSAVIAYVEPLLMNENTTRPNSKNKYNNKQNGNICSIRKQISDDYKEREAFLDTFCRQANSTTQGEEEPKKSNTIDFLIPKNRKKKLLAALKAIDDNKSQD